jgi:hypothetical protein
VRECCCRCALVVASPLAAGHGRPRASSFRDCTSICDVYHTAHANMTSINTTSPTARSPISRPTARPRECIDSTQCSLHARFCPPACAGCHSPPMGHGLWICSTCSTACTGYNRVFQIVAPAPTYQRAPSPWARARRRRPGRLDATPSPLKHLIRPRDGSSVVCLSAGSALHYHGQFNSLQAFVRSSRSATVGETCGGCSCFNLN